MRLRPTLAALAVLALASPLLPSASAEVEAGIGSASLTAVANLEYKALGVGGGKNRGTDIEFTKIRGTEYALAGTYQNGLQVIDIDDPTKPTVAGVYGCGVQQGDVQVFERSGRTYVGFTHDTGYTANQQTSCYKDAKKNGFSQAVGSGGFGTMIADITEVGNDALPPSERIKTVSFVPFIKGSHNHTIHPSGNFIYNSNSELVTNIAANEIEIFDIRDLKAPQKLPSLDLPPVPTGLGADSHDITFSADGKRAYSAALSQTAVIDTTNPAAPRIISTIVDPTINVVHQSDPVRLKDAKTGLERDFLIIEDEFAGATGTGQCPNGGVHVYDVTGPLEQAPVKVGYWNISEARPTTSVSDSCTAHVFDLDAKSAKMTIAYYNGGVRVVDLSGLVGVALGGTGVGMKEVGFRRFTDSDTWAAKTNKIAEDGSFFLFGNDQARGLDVYKFDAGKATSASPGVWMSAAEAKTALASRSRIDLSDYRMRCLAAAASDTLSPVEAALQKAHHA